MLDNILLALQSLRANKMRALLTMLGIIIGIGSVIAIKTVGFSLSSSITDSMSGFGISNISVTLTQKDTDDSSGTDSNVHVRMFQNSTPGSDDLITDAMIAEYRAAFPNDVACIELTQSVGSGTVTKDDDTTTATVMGVNDEYLTGEEVNVLYGRGIENDADGTRKVCVVSEKFVEDCMDVTPINAVGQSVTLTINSMPYTFYIEGVYEYDEDEDSLIMTSNDSDDVVTDFYIPMGTAREISGSTADGYQSITVVAEASTDVSTFLTTTQDYFATFYTRNDTWTVEASSLESLVSTITDVLDKVSLAISAIAAISLLVGGIGVMNIMLVSITERTREIGTRKALGAPQSAIRVQFIVESVVICLVGGVIGILVGLALGAGACKLLGYAARPDALTIVLAVGFSMAIGVFFGYYPANKAAKLDPIEALRYE
jgi:putative ABC transport system permease protein